MTNKTPTLTFAALNSEKHNICVALSEKDGFPSTLKALDEQSGGMIARAAAIAKFDGSKKVIADILAPHEVNVERLFIMGLGDPKKYTETDWMALGGRICARLGNARAASADIILELSETDSISAQNAAQVALGAMLRCYEFKKYKKKKKKASEEENGVAGIKSLRILCAHPEKAKSYFRDLKAVGEGVRLARDLVNEPANILGPLEFAEQVTALQKHGLDVEVLDKKQLESIGMGALLAVGQGSARPSQVVVMQWNGGKEDQKPIAFVGKGVCFDSGGISIKPAQNMEEMKGDMAGAAAVTGAMLALAERKAAVNAVGIIGLVENMPSSTAQRPGDIVTSLSGQTIEVVNTDAEGRMVLADIMWYAQDRFAPQAMITLATLTGAIIVALGKEHAGLLANNDELSERLIAAGLETGDKVWRLPLDPKYNKKMDSKVADMRNAGARDAGSITAAEFLQRFVKDNRNWAHLDIAGTAMAAPTTDINQGWASGFGVMLLNRLINKYYEVR
jgi:leucyl aminopeptidase